MFLEFESCETINWGLLLIGENSYVQRKNGMLGGREGSKLGKSLVVLYELRISFLDEKITSNILRARYGIKDSSMQHTTSRHTSTNTDKNSSQKNMF